jgi:hypothetical protein
MANPHSPHEMYRHLVFSELKLELWEAALDRTAHDASAFDLSLSRSLSARHRATGRPDTEAKYTIFAQVGGLCRLSTMRHERRLRRRSEALKGL